MYRNKITLLSVTLFVCVLFFGFECLAIEQTQIRFYGKLLDQYNEPVPAAVVHIMVSTTDTANGLKKVVLRTDENGLFALADTGSSFEIMSIKKKGYKFSNMRKTPVGLSKNTRAKGETKMFLTRLGVFC